MDKLNRIKTLLESIGLQESIEFTYDEVAILNEYAIQESNKSSMTIKVLSVFGGFLATLSFIGFLAIAGLYKSEVGLLIFGIGFVILAILLNKKFDKLIIDTFSISLYMAGLILMTFAFSELDINFNIAAIIIGLTALISLIITQNFILSFISVLTISGSFIAMIIYNNTYNLIHLYIAVYILAITYIFLYEAKFMTSNKKLSRLYSPVRIGLIFSLLFGLAAIGKKDLIDITENYIWLTSVVTISVIFYLVYTIIKIHEIDALKNKVLIYALSGFLLIPTLYAPSISGAMVIILLSFLVNYKTGLTIGILSIICFMSQYYYDLNITLLTKSIILMVSGMVFMAFYIFTIKNKKS